MLRFSPIVFLMGHALAACDNLYPLRSDKPVALNAGASWENWELIGDSSRTGPLWYTGQALDSTFSGNTFNVYRSRFTLTANDEITGTRDCTSSQSPATSYQGDEWLQGGSWRVGDRIYGIGIQTTGVTKTRGLDRIFLHSDKCGDSISPRVGTSPGSYTANRFDTSTLVWQAANNAKCYQAYQFSIFTDYTANGGSNYIYRDPKQPDLRHQVRSFVKFVPGRTNAWESATFLFNVDALARNALDGSWKDHNAQPWSSPEPSAVGFGAETKLGFWVGQSNYAVPQNTNPNWSWWSYADSVAWNFDDQQCERPYAQCPAPPTPAPTPAPTPEPTPEPTPVIEPSTTAGPGNGETTTTQAPECPVGSHPERKCHFEGPDCPLESSP